MLDGIIFPCFFCFNKMMVTNNINGNDQEKTQKRNNAKKILNF